MREPNFPTSKPILPRGITLTLRLIEWLSHVVSEPHYSMRKMLWPWSKDCLNAYAQPQSGTADTCYKRNLALGKMVAGD